MDGQLILDRYRPLEDLAEGAFGLVTLAWDTRMQRRVAIKRLPLPRDAYGAPERPHGLAEARTAAMLNHPNIVTVFDFDMDSDEAFLVMEYVDGRSLADLLDDVGGSLTLDEAAAIFADVSSAIVFAHENGVLHLDIKPENVLFTRSGRAKVADFGIAELSTLAGHGSAFGGTPGYMPIEQLEGSPVSERTDEWALAALTYEIVTGDNPFADATTEGAIVRLEVYEPPLPSTYDPHIPAAVDDVLLAALGPRPADRYPHVGAFADALLPLLGDAEEGRASIASLVEAYSEEDDAEDSAPAGIGLWDRLNGRAGMAVARALAAVEAAWLAWAGLTPLGLESLALFGAVALVALAAALAPGLGIGLGLACFVVGLIAGGAWVVGIAVLLLGGAWWWLFARRSAGAAVLPLSGPILALARMAFAQPLLAGFSLPPLRAGVTAVLGGALTMVASAASLNPEPYLSVVPSYAFDIWHANLSAAAVAALVTSPGAWVALAGWPLAAIAMSLACSRATRLGATVGALAGSAILGGAYLLADRVAQATGTAGGYESPELAVTLGASLILVLLVAALGAPLRAEEEEPLALQPSDYEDD